VVGEASSKVGAHDVEAVFANELAKTTGITLGNVGNKSHFGVEELVLGSGISLIIAHGTEIISGVFAAEGIVWCVYGAGDMLLSGVVYPQNPIKEREVYVEEQIVGFVDAKALKRRRVECCTWHDVSKKAFCLRGSFGVFRASLGLS